MSTDGQEGIVELNINALPLTFLLTNMQIQRLTTLPHEIVENHVQAVQHNGHFYHLNPELVFDVNKIVLFLSPQKIQCPRTRRVLQQAMTTVDLAT